MGEDKALRDQIAQAIHEADCECTQFYQHQLRSLLPQEGPDKEDAER